jgi:hypothetical protein
MAKFGFILAATLILASPVILAEENDPRSWGYLFGGTGSCNHGYGFFHTGGGGQGLLKGGLGLTGEVGYFGFFEVPGEGVGLLSPGVVYSFNRGGKTLPFVTGGYTLFFRQGIANGFYFGGGVDRWMGNRWGIRIEGRDQVMPACNEHLIEVRLGIILR